MAEIRSETCPVCGIESRIENVSRIEKTPVRGEEVEAEVVFSRCATCGEEFVDAVGMERNLEAAYSVYRTAHGYEFARDLSGL